MINNQSEYEAAMLAVSPLVKLDPKRGTALACILEVLAAAISAYEDTQQYCEANDCNAIVLNGDCTYCGKEHPVEISNPDQLEIGSNHD